MDSYDDASVHQGRGQLAAGLGVFSMALGSLLVVMCTCYSSLLFAVPLGLAAVWIGSRVRASSDDGAAVAYANMGMVTGGFGGLTSLLFTLLMAAYVGAYVLLIFAVIIGESM